MFHYLKSVKPALIIYTLKCVAGLGIGYLLYVNFPGHQFYWSLISILLVIAPDPQDSSKLAFNRMAANIIGSIIGLFLFITNGPSFLLLAIGVIATIIICSLLRLITVGRTALAAVLIVMIHEKSGNSWEVAFERMICVIVGCLIGLAVSIIFDFLIKKIVRLRIAKSLNSNSTGDNTKINIIKTIIL
jgi:uncharacterized membrane protein YgaE (UPF0421/DUF939 family)